MAHDEHSTAQRIASFRSFVGVDAETARAIDAVESRELHVSLADRILDGLRSLSAFDQAHPVDRLTHSLQTATRAEADGHDEAYLVCALVHDIGDLLAPDNHGDLAAAIVEPYVDTDLTFMVRHHPEFQGAHFWHHLGRDRDRYRRHQDHPAFEMTREFCDRYDALAFDPDYDTAPLEHFEPMLRRVLNPPDRPST